VKNCEKSLEGAPRGAELRIEIGGKKLILRARDQCEPMLLDPCMKDLTKGVSYPAGSGIANSKADCRKAFFTRCKSDEKVQKDNLLQHEQGHFDIAEELSKRVRPSVKAKAATVKADMTKCGQAAAEQAATEAFDKLKAELTDLMNAWSKVKDKAQDDYDFDTAHGTKAREQKDWENRIKAGLKDYDPKMLAAPAPASPNSPTQQPNSPTTPQATNPPPTTKPPPAAPKRTP
jgi:hypothetical protein